MCWFWQFWWLLIESYLCNLLYFPRISPYFNYCTLLSLQNSYCTGEAGREANDETAPPDVSEFPKSLSSSNAEPKTLVEIHQQLKLKALQELEQEQSKSKNDDESASSSDSDDSDSKNNKQTSSSSKTNKNQKKNAKRREKKKTRASKKKPGSSKNKKKHDSDSSSSDSSSSSSDSSDSEEDESAKKKKELAKALEIEQRRKGEEMDDRKRKYNSMYDAKAPTEMEMEAFLLTRSREEDPMLGFIEDKKRKKK